MRTGPSNRATPSKVVARRGREMPSFGNAAELFSTAALCSAARCARPERHWVDARSLQHAGVTIWDELSPEEQCVMINALEEAYLNGIIGGFLGRAEHDGTVWMFSNDGASNQGHDSTGRGCRA